MGYGGGFSSFFPQTKGCLMCNWFERSLLLWGVLHGTESPARQCQAQPPGKLLSPHHPAALPVHTPILLAPLPMPTEGAMS